MGPFYSHLIKAGYDADEVSVGATRDTDTEEVGGLASWDPHNHTDTDRGAAGGRTGMIAVGLKPAAAQARQIKAAHHLYLEVDTAIDTYAAQIVPPETWPSTERVTTHVAGTVDHTVSIDASTTSKGCDPGGCCGHDACKCNPGFRLTINKNGAALQVDGVQLGLAPPPPPPPGGRIDKAWEPGH